MIRYCDVGKIQLPDGLGIDSWFRFELKAGFVEGYLDLLYHDIIALHIKIVESGSVCIVNSFDEEWGAEKSISVDIHYEKFNLLHIREMPGQICVTLNEGMTVNFPTEIGLENIFEIKNNIGFAKLISTTSALTTGWRQCVKHSGIEATSPVSRRVGSLVPGITAIVRAKNEEQTIFGCLSKMAPSVDCVVAVDNLSSDATFSRMRDAQRGNFNIELFGYDGAVPKVGADHEAAVMANHANTLGRYYNFCLSKCKTANFMKWDADFLPIENNLEEMVRRYDLHTRTDNFSIWFSGVSVWTDGDRFWIDEEAHYNEFRVHSLMHGAKWVDLPPWEELDQSYLFKAQLFAFEKPVFIELFVIDPSEFENRGYCETDSRDRRRFEALRQYTANGELPESFTPIDSLESKLLRDRPLSEIDLNNADYMLKKYNSVPTLSIPETGQEIVHMESMEQKSLGVFCISHQANADRRQTLRDTVKTDFDTLGIPFYFVVGVPGRKAAIEGDVIILDCPDTYEFLSAKIAALTSFFVSNMNLQYMVKIDDDTCVNAVTFTQLPYYKYDYYGGGLAGGRDLSFDWHLGKCFNKQLDGITLIPTNGMSWYGGGFGYFLSRRAAAEIARNSRIMRSELYEDIAVSHILDDAGLLLDKLPPPFKTLAYRHAVSIPQAIHESPLIMDIPNCESIRSIYSKMKRVSIAHPAEDALNVNTDWLVYTMPASDAEGYVKVESTTTLSANKISSESVESDDGGLKDKQKDISELTGLNIVEIIKSA